MLGFAEILRRTPHICAPDCKFAPQRMTWWPDLPVLVSGQQTNDTSGKTTPSRSTAVLCRIPYTYRYVEQEIFFRPRGLRRMGKEQKKKKVLLIKDKKKVNSYSLSMICPLQPCPCLSAPHNPSHLLLRSVRVHARVMLYRYSKPRLV